MKTTAQWIIHKIHLFFSNEFKARKIFGQKRFISFEYQGGNGLVAFLVFFGFPDLLSFNQNVRNLLHNGRRFIKVLFFYKRILSFSSTTTRDEND